MRIGSLISMSLDHQEISRRRRAIDQSLRPFISGSTLDEALMIADRYFLNEPVFSALSFLDRIASLDPRITANKGKIFNSIQRIRNGVPVMNFPDISEIETNRSSTQTVERTSTQVVTAPARVRSGKSLADFNLDEVSTRPSSGWNVIFDQLINQITGQLAAMRPGSTKTLEGHVRLSLPRLQISPIAMDEFLRWSRNSSGFRISASVQSSEMQQFVHLVYLWCCTELGPIQAFRIFAKAMQQVEAMPESVQFPPKSLL
jgi:hypothetical protein